MSNVRQPGHGTKNHCAIGSLRTHREKTVSWVRRKLFLAGLSAAGLGLVPTTKGFAQSLDWRIGDAVTLPPLALLDETPVDWPSLRGKVIVLEFWGSWCPFCARQNPLLNKFYLDHRARGLEVITISLDKTKQSAIDYMKKGGYSFKAGMVTPAWNAIYKQRKGLPQLFVIDRQGRLSAIEVREMMEEDIREIARYL